MLSEANLACKTLRLAGTLKQYACCKPRFISHLSVEDIVEANLQDGSRRKLVDLITSYRCELLEFTLANYLRSTSKRFVRPGPALLPPGYHFIFFPTSTSELDTLEDGYERHFAPTHPFKRRVWTQGRLEFKGKGLAVGNWAECLEEVSKVNSAGNATDVWIERKIYETPNTNNAENWSIRELRCLRYLRNIPALRRTEHAQYSSIVSVPSSKASNPILVHTFTPSRILLTRFSFLTYNFHRIHLDPEYAQTAEQYPDVLVHGSLSVTLILTMIRQLYESLNKDFLITSAKYLMYRPLYVDSPVTLAVTYTKSGRHRAVLWNNHHQKAVECIIGHVQVA